MQELAKSMGSFTWAMSLFGLQQALNITRAPAAGSQSSPATDAFNAVTQAVVQQLGDAARQSFDAADRLQRQMVDAGASVLTVGTRLPNRTAADAPKNASATSNETQLGWGPVPPSPQS